MSGPFQVFGSERKIHEREVSFNGDPSAKQKDRLLAIANRCPVHRTLTSQIQIRTSESAAARTGQ
jgi:putative redox protein